MKSSSTKRRSGSVLSLSFDGSRMDAVVLRRTNGSVEITDVLATPLSLNILSHEAELVGQEIRQQLQSGDIRERRCLVALPQNWALTAQVDVPDLGESDLEGFFQMEGERAFSAGPDAISLGVSQFRTPDGERRATIIGIPRDHLGRLDAVLRAAKLEPVGFFLGMPPLHDLASKSGEPSLSLMVGENSVSLEVGSDAGIASLRALDNAMDGEGAVREINLPVLLRELKITLAQLPQALRAALRVLRLFGSSAACEALGQQLRQPLQSMGLAVERVTALSSTKLGITLPATASANPHTAIAASYLADKSLGTDFRPPRVSAWQQFATRYSSKSLTYAAMALVVLALIVAGFFTFQEVQLSRSTKDWKSMEKRVEELESLQQNIKQYRPWFDASVRHLTILKRLSEVFPEDGTVTAKTLEIRDGGNVTCAGSTKDAPVFYKMLDQLRASKDVSDVTVDQLRGEASRQFTFSFHWGERTQP